jgi:transposase
MKVTVFGLDLAKRVFQAHWVDVETGEICRRQLKRTQVAEFFAQREASVIAMEACGSAHHGRASLLPWGMRCV